MSTTVLLVTPSEPTRDQVIALLGELEYTSEPVVVASVAQMRHELASGVIYDVALVDERVESGAGFDAAREIQAHHPLVAVLLLVHFADEEALAAALDVGARGVVPLPPTLELLGQRLEAAAHWARTARQAGEDLVKPASGAGRVVALVGAKGGVGTTTLAVCLARAGVDAGRTCLVDLDVRRGDVAPYCGIAVRRTIVDLVEVADELTGRALGEVTYPAAHGLELVPAPADGELGELLDEHAVRQILAALRFQYDLVVVDCGSRLDDVLAQALDSADEVLVVATPDVPALRAVRRLDETLDRLAVGIGVPRRLLLNRVAKLREVQPASAPKLADMPMAAAVRELNRELDQVMNSAQLLEAPLPALDSALAPVIDGLDARRRPERTAPDVPASARDAEPSSGSGRRERRFGRRRVRAQAGQLVAEVPVAIALVFATALLALQVILWGATYLFAANAAQTAARSYGVGLSHSEVRGAVHEDLPASWVIGASVSGPGGDEVTVSLRTPSVVDLPPVTATSAIVWERR